MFILFQNDIHPLTLVSAFAQRIALLTGVPEAIINPRAWETIMNNLFSVSEITINYFPKFKPADRPQIKQSADAFEILNNNWGDHLMYKESFYILLLNRANKVLGMTNISVGGISGTVADPKLIFQTALKANASGIILAHNHPSGNLKPSENDISLTKKIKSAGEFLEISVLDHLIIGQDDSYSFADEGLL